MKMLFAFTGMLFTLNAQAETPLAALTDRGPSLLLENASGAFNHWKGIGRLESLGSSRCTAVLIDTRSPGSPRNAPAYVLSSGHCNHPQVGMTATNLKLQGHMEFNYFRDSADQRQVYPLKRLVWSSQQNIDLAVVELAVPLQQLIDDGIQPLKLADTQPAVNDAVLAVGAPEIAGNGYTLRASACTFEGNVDIAEFPYVWNANLRNRCQDVLPGASGSPLLNRSDGKIVGITGTTTRGSQEADQCLKDAPCELTDGQGAWHADTNYASPVTRLNACLANGRFDMSRPGCDMQPTFTVFPHQPFALIPILKVATRHPAWDLRFSTDTSHYYRKLARQPSQCQDPRGYGEALSSKNARIHPPRLTEPGVHLLCLVGSDLSTDPLPTSAVRNAFVLPMRAVDDTPPPTQNLTLTRLENGRESVVFNYTTRVPHYQYKFGNPATTDCADDRGYKHAFYAFTISPRLMPATLCTRTTDVAGTVSPPRSDLIQ